MTTVKKYWKFTQESPSSVWNIDNIPEEAIDPVITHIKNDRGEILQPESQALAPYGIQLSFGVTEERGVAYGEYDAESPSVIVDGNGNSVTINISQGGVPSTGSSFSV